MNILFSLLKAFIIGGLFCVIAQILIDKTHLTPARILVGYVVLGVILSSFGLYNHIVDFAGSGATVPLTGFGNALANGVKKAIDENGFIGIFSGGLTATSSGICATLVFSFIASLIFPSRPK